MGEHFCFFCKKIIGCHLGSAIESFLDIDCCMGCWASVSVPFKISGKEGFCMPGRKFFRALPDHLLAKIFYYTAQEENNFHKRTSILYRRVAAKEWRRRNEKD